ncbi:MAG: CT583 family protein [Waddliaceae bacterium]
MSKANALISKRLAKKGPSEKMQKMAEISARGDRSSFSGIFGLGELTNNEREHIEAILHEFSTGKENIEGDLSELLSITSEVKAINNQAALLHGERIKKAHEVLIKYKEGAFTTWLMATYGNRQTPYNFLQYFNFYTEMPKELHKQIETMPRQAIYTLASRPGSLSIKQKIVESYSGETKAEMLSQIREAFPLSEEDGRKKPIGEEVATTLERLCNKLQKRKAVITKAKKRDIFALIEELEELVDVCPLR